LNQTNRHGSITTNKLVEFIVEGECSLFRCEFMHMVMITWVSVIVAVLHIIQDKPSSASNNDNRRTKIIYNIDICI